MYQYSTRLVFQNRRLRVIFLLICISSPEHATSVSVSGTDWVLLFFRCVFEWSGAQYVGFCFIFGYNYSSL